MMKMQITKRTFRITAVIGGMLLTLMIIINTVVSTRQTTKATNEAVYEVSTFYLEAMADRRAKTITNLIDRNFSQMDKAVAYIHNEGIRTEKQLRDALGNIKSLLSLDRFALVDNDKIVHTQYTTYTGGSRHDFLAGDFEDHRSVSTVSLYGSSKQLCLAAPTSELTIAGKKYIASFVQIDIGEIVNLLAFDDSKTYFGIYSKKGENLSDTELGPYISKHNLFDALKSVVSGETLNEKQGDFLDAKQGSITFTTKGMEETLSKNDLEAEKENAKNFQNMATTDSMTGVRNKHAYSEAESHLNTKIRHKEIHKLAVVVCDINGLKIVNDTLGHAAGDKLIKDACSMICEYFTHGAVYRIGGDEFVVILQEKGFDTMQEVIDDINRAIEENIRKKEVVISIGYSKLTPEDQLLHDVFERADQMMYERKKKKKTSRYLRKE